MKNLIPFLIAIALSPFLTLMLNFAIAKLILSFCKVNSDENALYKAKKTIIIDSVAGFLFLLPIGIAIVFLGLSFFVNLDAKIPYIFQSQQVLIFTFFLLMSLLSHIFLSEKVVLTDEVILFYQFFQEKKSIKSSEILSIKSYANWINYRDKKIIIHLKDKTEIKTSIPISKIDLFSLVVEKTLN